MPKKKVVITQDQVDEFAVICARMKVDGDRRKELRLEFIKAREENVKFPETGPHLVDFVDKSRLDVNWESEAFLLARVLLGSWEAATEHIAAVKAEGDRTPIVEVSTKVNPNWATKAGVITMPTVNKARVR